MIHGGRVVSMAARLMQKKHFGTEIFVSRLSFYTTDEEFHKTFSPFGTILEARLFKDSRTQRPKGFGFIRYSLQAEAEKAVKAMDGRILRGRLIFVELAKGRKSE